MKELLAVIVFGIIVVWFVIPTVESITSRCLDFLHKHLGGN